MKNIHTKPFSDRDSDSSVLFIRLKRTTMDKFRSSKLLLGYKSNAEFFEYILDDYYKRHKKNTPPPQFIYITRTND